METLLFAVWADFDNLACGCDIDTDLRLQNQISFHALRNAAAITQAKCFCWCRSRSFKRCARAKTGIN